MVNDHIADALTRIRNAQDANLDKVEVLYSKIVARVAEVLKSRGFLTKIEKVKTKNRLTTGLCLYFSDQKIISLKRVSKPGCRVYVSRARIPTPAHGIGFTILSTQAGILDSKTARAKGVGGEVICEVC